MSKIAKRAVLRSRRQSEWFNMSTRGGYKQAFINVEAARAHAESVIQHADDVAKIIVEYDWKINQYVNHYLGDDDTYKGSMDVYGTFQKKPQRY